MGSHLHGPPDGTLPPGIQQRYLEEASKRFRDDGLNQFLNLKDAESARLRVLAEDPWVNHAELNARPPVIQDGGRHKFIILGAGYGGLILAARLIDAGLVMDPEDLRLVDAAGGFGGTWYWNRYPGLHCDVESYMYMPLLEETGYVPAKKYASGPELREYADLMAEKWDLNDKALFRSVVTSLVWDDETKLWNVEIRENRGPGEKSVSLTAQAQYVAIATGLLTEPHVPRIPGLESFSRAMFHTSRWDYSVTGGTPEAPEMNNLQGKRVGIIGTGATAIQVVPQLAKWAKEVHVFQRTPSTVNWRGQRPTDPVEWKTKIATGKGWQRERTFNFMKFVTNSAAPGEENLVADGWTELPSFSALLGSEAADKIEPTPEGIQAHVARLYAMDFPCSERLRARVDVIVKDREKASKLKAWYPIWCKRPCFSDEYLQAFSHTHVQLVDTDGKGISGATTTGLVVGGKEYPLDILVLSTGFRSPAIANGSPAARLEIDVLGREGRSLDEKWQNFGAATLHGVTSNGFPNLFFMGPAQAGASANIVHVLDMLAEHIVHIVAEADRRIEKTAVRETVDGIQPHAVVEVTSEAEEAWTAEVVKGAAWYAGLAGCTPGLVTLEGEARKVTDPREQAKKARSSCWCKGTRDFVSVLEEWRKEGSMHGLDVSMA